jgi:hypothetical protein
LFHTFFGCGANEEPASSAVRMLMACSMGSERAMAICSSISLELDKDIIYVKRVKMNWYESDLSSNHWGEFWDFFEFFGTQTFKNS